jgi:hypothetical protein
VVQLSGLYEASASQQTPIISRSPKGFGLGALCHVTDGTAVSPALHERVFAGNAGLDHVNSAVFGNAWTEAVREVVDIHTQSLDWKHLVINIAVNTVEYLHVITHQTPRTSVSSSFLMVMSGLLCPVMILAIASSLETVGTCVLFLRIMGRGVSLGPGGVGAM